MADRLPTVERFVVFTDHAHMPATKLKNAVAYEDWIAEVDSDFAWAEFDERTAAGLCYTSGTTGSPNACFIRIARMFCTRCWRARPTP